MTTKLLYDLLDVGLTEGEAKVYLALSELGSSTVGPIIKKAGIASSNVYDILNRLLEKGIASYIMKSKVKYYQAANPRTLLEFLHNKETELQEKKESLTKVLPELEKIQQLNVKQHAEIFFGQRGLKAAYEKHLVKLNKNTENLFMYLHKERFAEQSDLLYFNMLDLYLRVPQRGIANEFARKSPFFIKTKKTINTRFVEFPIPGQIEVCNDSLLLVSWEENITTVLINSPDIAENMRLYFNEIWKVAKT